MWYKLKWIKSTPYIFIVTNDTIGCLMNNNTMTSHNSHVDILLIYISCICIVIITFSNNASSVSFAFIAVSHVQHRLIDNAYITTKNTNTCIMSCLAEPKWPEWKVVSYFLIPKIFKRRSIYSSSIFCYCCDFIVGSTMLNYGLLTLKSKAHNLDVKVSPKC